jgi:hypothetical protein
VLLHIGIIWGVAWDGKLYHKSGGVWVYVGTPFKWVSCGKFGCWAVTSQDLAYFRVGVTESNLGGDSWENTGGSFKQLDTGVRGEVYAVDDEGQVYTREGVTETLPYGTKWSKFGNMLFSHVSVGEKSVIAAAANGYDYWLDIP